MPHCPVTEESGFTPSYEALGRLLKKKKKNMMTKIRISHMSDFSCGETKVRKAFLWLAKGPERYQWGFGAPLVVSRRVIKHCLCISREICTVPSLYRPSNKVLPRADSSAIVANCRI